MKIEIYDKNWTEEYVSSNSDKIFVFGDNNTRMGKGGQAVIRGLENTVGLRTKNGPSQTSAAYFNDSLYDKNIKKIDKDILLIKSLALKGKTIVFSKNGYGTGLALMEEKAPKTFQYLCDSLKNHFGFDNKRGTKWSKIPGYDQISKGIYITMDKKSGILLPMNESMELKELIKEGKKIAFTQNKFYKSDSILIFVIPGLDEYFVVRVSSSYELEKIDKEMWLLFEGYNEEYIENFSDFLQRGGYYQTHFEFICSLDKSGRMIFRDDIFGGYDKPKVEIDKKKLSKTGNKEVNQNEKEVKNMKKNNDDKLSKEELFEIINDLKSEIKKIKTPWYKRLFNELKQKFSRKSLEYILDKKDLKGDLTIIDNVFNKEKNKTYYKLVTEKYTHFLVFYKGIFSNKVYVVLTFTHE